MSQYLYARCLLLSNSSFVVVLPPPMMLSLVPILGKCGSKDYNVVMPIYIEIQITFGGITFSFQIYEKYMTFLKTDFFELSY